MRVVVAVFFEPAGRLRGLGRGAAASLVLGCVGRSSAPSTTSVRLFARLPRICAVRFTTRRAFRGLPRGCGPRPLELRRSELILRLRPVRRTKERDFASRLCRPGYNAHRGVTHYSSVLVAFALLVIRSFLLHVW